MPGAGDVPPLEPSQPTSPPPITRHAAPIIRDADANKTGNQQVGI